MQRGLRLALIVLVLLAVPAQAKPDEGAADRALADSKEAVDDVVDGLGTAGERVGDAVGDAGKGLGDAAGSVGRSVGRILAAVGSAAAATLQVAGAFSLLAAARIA
ncbi:MAG TPA: hypothetical protein VI796_05970, partial [Candidatus Thermoplasmatota archaeon]|nr:hypothetical protein [Candidatus Thermoplasmatota archaeon]